MNRMCRCFIYVGVLSMMLTGCGVKTVEDIDQYATSIQNITIPEEVKIVALGEATHGNRELQSLKKEVFQLLNENADCHVFALEADFGGAYRVNEYIHGGEGTTKAAINELGFGLYRTDEMIDLVESFREYNKTVEEEKQISFYGFDMQRYDNNKEILFSYLSKVDKNSKQELEGKLSMLTDETVYTQAKEVNQKAVSDMEVFLENMKEKRDEYIAKSDEKSYEIAFACAECIWQNATIQSGTVSYNEARDQYMTEKVERIMEIEKGARVFITGHNGHIQKKSPNITYTCMGEQLAEKYASEYYAIGTDFIEGKVNVINGLGNETAIKMKANNALKDQVKGLEGNVFYFDVNNCENNETLSDIMHNPVRIISVGNEFSTWQKVVKSFYTTNDVIADNYDGIVILKHVTPTERKPIGE